MALTPVEIRHLTPSTGFLGYKRAQTDKLLADIAASFEDVWRDRADLADKVDQLETDIVRYKEIEALLRTTLVSAERAASDLKEQARREADVILAEAHSEARAVKRRAMAENERLRLETSLLKERLRAVLAVVEQAEDTLHGVKLDVKDAEAGVKLDVKDAEAA